MSMAFGSVGHYNEVRKINKQKLLQFIQEHPDQPLSKTLGLFSMNTGLTVSTLEIYVKELRMAELIE